MTRGLGRAAGSLLQKTAAGIGLAALVGTLVVAPTVAHATQPAVAPAAVLPTPISKVTDGSGFNPGFIITDSQFYNSQAMSAAEIQQFLDSKIGTCTNGRCLNVAVVDFAGRGREISLTTGQVVCEAIAGGSMRVAELIYRTQVACGISAKVILVTLQKEQGLVTNRAPSDWALSHAMGMACPDTAPCDEAFSGLARQIVTGTRQLKAYRALPFARQPGLHYIGWSPNASCGGTNVYIENYATAALYNYTPYQPNAAALANPYGTGDSCSSYGNRNFWVYYSDWFENPVSGEGAGAKAISDAWAANGGKTGPWGNRLSYMPCNTGVTCGHVFENVYVGWTATGGIFTATGRIKDFVLSQGISVVGSPNSGEVPVSANGGGVAQSFTLALVNWGPSGPFLVSGPIREEHARLGGVGGATGWPTSAMRCDSTNHCAQSFQNAVIGSTPSGAGFSVTDPAVLAYYLARGGHTGSLGSPQSQLVAVSQNGGGKQQAFQKGLINVTPTGIFTITQQFRAAQSAAGGVGGPIGWPTAEETCSGGVCSQTFQNALFLARGSDVRTIADPQLLAYFQASGGVAGSLGFPTTDKIVVTSPHGDGWQMAFEKGLLESSAAGTFTVKDAIRDAHGAAGGVRGSMGWPTSEQACSGSACSQTFQNGLIVITPDRSVRTIASAAIASYFQSAGGLGGRLGHPLTNSVVVPASSNGGGVQVAFQYGLVESSASGTFTVKDAIREAHGAAGGVGGSLGWPTGEQSCSGGVCTQSFQGGTIRVSGSQVQIIRTVADPTIAAYYESTGGASGPLGYPLTGVIPVPASSNGGGVQVAFEYGLVESSASGTFTVKDAIREAHGAAGGVGGSLGWPTGEQSCSGGVCTQSFQGGTIRVSGSQVQIIRTVADATVAAYYEASGGASGPLGYPISGVITVPSSWANGGGVQVAFEYGLVESSASGTFTVKDAIREAHGAAGGVGGSLGWPTGEQSCSDGVCTQSFQNGTIRVSGNQVQVVRTITDATVAAYYEASGGASGPLGYPISGVITVPSSWANGGGVQVAFEYGLVESSASGTFTVKDAIREAHGAAGGVGGRYGWPIGEQNCSASSCTQDFQNGTITVSR